MTEPATTGGPAFPCDQIIARDEKGHMCGVEVSGPGMTLRQYAAIKLLVPDSGSPWLDEMIVTAKRDHLAAKAMQAMLSSPNCPMVVSGSELASQAYETADALLLAAPTGVW